MNNEERKIIETIMPCTICGKKAKVVHSLNCLNASCKFCGIENKTVCEWNSFQAKIRNKIKQARQDERNKGRKELMIKFKEISNKYLKRTGNVKVSLGITYILDEVEKGEKK